MFHTYILQSLVSGRLYIGHTNNLSERILRHNLNKNRYTKGKGPWKPIFSKEFKTRSEAMALEKKLKGFKNKERILNWIKRNKIG